MNSEPPLPDNYEPPSTVNGWELKRRHNSHSHIWVGPEETASIAVSAMGGVVSAKVLDDRVTGLGRRKSLFEREYEYTKPHISPVDEDAPGEDVVDAIEAARRWMTINGPPWRHPEVIPEAFQPPVGFHLDRYYLKERTQRIFYLQDGEKSRSNLFASEPITEPSLETRRYLIVECFRGSGDASVKLAPWLQAGDDVAHPVIECPDGCGLSVALKLAREWVEKQSENTTQGAVVGQSGLSEWGDPDEKTCAD